MSECPGEKRPSSPIIACQADLPAQSSAMSGCFGQEGPPEAHPVRRVGVTAVSGSGCFGRRIVVTVVSFGERDLWEDEMN